MSDKKSLGRKIYIRELLENQLKSIPLERRLINRDIVRISKYIDSSVFGNECCLWSGYITNTKNNNKGSYINFFFRNTKVPLHRLLYENYVEPLGNEHYIKFSCDEIHGHSGRCCNVNHMIKCKYKNGTTDEVKLQKIIEKKKLPDKIDDIKVFFD
jgi:hypothetical protein